MSESLTLYNIESELLQLLELREDLLSCPQEGEKLSPGGRSIAIQAIDGQIEMYLRKELQKVDGIAYMLAELNRRADIAMEEANRQEKRSKVWESRADSLKAYVERIMQETGKTKLEGEFNTLTLRKCPASVDIRQPELLPNEFKRFEIKVPGDVWQSLVAELLCKDERTDDDIETIKAELGKLKVSEPTPAKSYIAQVLKAGGGIPGCELVTDKVSLQVK